MTGPVELLNEKLKRYSFFGECILWEFHSVRFGYGLDLTINYIWDDNRNVRERVLEEPFLFVFQLLGVDSIRLVADLTPGMKADPDLIDWGFAEVARIEAFESRAGCGLSIKWEGERRLDVEFYDYILLSPKGHRL
jgi:hypothetical protein